MEVFSLIEFLSGLVISFLVGFASNYAWNRYHSSEVDKKNREFLNHFEGWWIEKINGQPDRIFSCAEFYYNEKAREYQYKGKNFYNDGRLYYKWQTYATQIDGRNERLLYIYQTYKEGIREQKWGFGISEYRIINKKCFFTDGFFMDSTKDNIGNRRDVTFARLEDIAIKINYKIPDYSDKSLGDFIRTVVQWEQDKGSVI